MTALIKKRQRFSDNGNKEFHLKLAFITLLNTIAFSFQLSVAVILALKGEAIFVEPVLTWIMAFMWQIFECTACLLIV